MLTQSSARALTVGAAALAVGVLNYSRAFADAPQVGEPAATLDEVTVTAQRRGNESLSKVPVSIDVLGGQALDHTNLQSVTEAINQVSGVTMLDQKQSGGAQIAVRGVTAGGPLFYGSSTVGYYLDDVPFAFVKSAIAPDADAYDLQRVEVLRGPQGTLYGASALNGVVRVLTNDANLNNFEFKMRGSTSNTEGGGENYRGDFAVNAPIIPGKLAARAVVDYNNTSGWLNNAFATDTNTSEVANVRLKINARPTDNSSIKLSYWHSSSHYGAPSASDDKGFNDTTIPEPYKVKYDTVGLSGEYAFRSFTLSSATSYIDYSGKGDLDYAHLAPLYTGLFTKTLAEEIGLHSTLDGPWNWSAGAIYRHSQDQLVQTLGTFLPAPINWTDRSASAAVFGEVGRRLLDNTVELSAGVRSFHDDVTSQENVQGQGNPNVPLYHRDSTFNSTTPRLVATWYPVDELTFYASYSQGFRSGFAQNANVFVAAPEIPAVRPDKLTNYEIGSKGSIIDHLVFFDAAVYYMKWKDIQQTLLVQLPNNVQTSAVVNGKGASGVGFDYGLTVRPAEGLSIRGSVGWNDLSLDSDVVSGGVVLFRKGDRPNESAQTTTSLSGQYEFRLGGTGYKGELSATATYHSKLASRTIASGALQTASSDSIFDNQLEASLKSPEHWTTSLFASNVSNRFGITDNTPASATLATVRQRPRIIGLQFEYSY